MAKYPSESGCRGLAADTDRGEPYGLGRPLPGAARIRRGFAGEPEPGVVRRSRAGTALLWASPALASVVHDVRAAREHGIIDALAQAGINCWADKGYQGAGGTVHLPYRGRWDSLSAGQQAVNRSHAKVRALVEQAVATLKSWRLLRKLRCSTTRITSLVQAVLTLRLATSD